MNIAMRSANPDDVSALVNLMADFYAEAGHPLERAWAARSLAALLTAPSRGGIWIVFEDTEAAGYVALTVRFSMEYGGLVGFIDDLYVRPKSRRRGLAELALRALFDECTLRGVVAVHVEVGEENVSAQALCARLGLKLRTDARQLLTVRLPNGGTRA